MNTGEVIGSQLKIIRVAVWMLIRIAEINCAECEPQALVFSPDASAFGSVGAQVFPAIRIRGYCERVCGDSSH